MEHWRVVKLWITGTFLFWVPYSVPSWVVDYFLLGGVFIRPYALHNTKKSEDRAAEGMREQKVNAYTVKHQAGIPLVWIIPSLLFWPVVFFDEVKDFLFDRIRGFKNPQTEATFKMFFISVISFLPLLFVTTDLIGTFGLLER